MKEAYIIDGVRTAIGSFGGTLGSVRADDMAAFVLRELMNRNKDVDREKIGDVVLGCANQAGEDNRNIARMSLLLAGLPVTVPGQTVNRLCASGMSAAIDAARAIQCGQEDVMIAGGVENMTRGPWVIGKAGAAFGRDQKMYDSSFGWRFINPRMKELYGTEAMGETAENVAAKYKISREDQDKFAFWSQQKAAAAKNAGRFDKEIVALSIPQKKADALIFRNDEFAKPGTTPEVLAKLKPSFRTDGTVTAGNASGLNDGGAALLLAGEQEVKSRNLKPLARIVASAAVGVDPAYMGIGPVEAANKALKRAGISFAELGVIELNEAFAAQSLACIRAWGLTDNDERLNPNGGAIALGHPLGMSGARIMLSAAIQLQETKQKYALATMCVGVGQGYAVILERA